jgi:hypothetical protein
MYATKNIKGGKKQEAWSTLMSSSFSCGSVSSFLPLQSPRAALILFYDEGYLIHKSHPNRMCCILSFDKDSINPL